MNNDDVVLWWEERKVEEEDVASSFLSSFGKNRVGIVVHRVVDDGILAPLS